MAARKHRKARRENKSHGCKFCHRNKAKWGWRSGGKHGGWIDSYQLDFKPDTQELLRTCLTEQAINSLQEHAKHYLMDSEDYETRPLLSEQKAELQICTNVASQLSEILGQGAKSLDRRTHHLLLDRVIITYREEGVGVIRELNNLLDKLLVGCYLAADHLDKSTHDSTHYYERRFAEAVAKLMDSSGTAATHYEEGNYANLLRLLIRDLSNTEPTDGKIKNLLKVILAPTSNKS